MGTEWTTNWGPKPLLDEATEQLTEHGIDPFDGASLVAELERTSGAAARASLYVDLGCCRLLAGDVAGALACWRHAATSTQPAPSARAWYDLGRLHAELGLIDVAGANFDAAAAAVEPFRSRARLAKAHLAMRDGEHESAMRDLAALADDVLDHNADHPLLGRVLLGLGDVSARLGLFERAVNALEAARSASGEPERSAASGALVEVLERSGMVRRAAEIAAELGEPTVDVNALLDRVEELVRDGRSDEAAELLELVERMPRTTEHRFRAVAHLVEIGRVNAAIDELERLHRRDEPDDRARASYLLGEIYAAYDRVDLAESFLSAVGPIRQGHWAERAALALGDLAHVRGDADRARQCWERAAVSRSRSVAAGAQRRLHDEEQRQQSGTSESLMIEAMVSVADADDPIAPGLDLLAEAPIERPAVAAEPKVVRLTRRQTGPVATAEPRIVRLVRPAAPAARAADEPEREQARRPRERPVEAPRRTDGAFSRLT